MVNDVNKHGEKAEKAYASFVRHFENTYTPDVRASMLDFYQKLFVKEAIAAQVDGDMTKEDNEKLLKMQEDLTQKVRDEFTRVWQSPTSKSSSTRLKPIVAAQPRGHLKLVGGSN